MFFSFTIQAKSWNNGFDRYRDNQDDFWQFVDNRQFRQQERINHGVDTGQLTRRETRVLRRENKKLNRLIRRYQRKPFLRGHQKRDIILCLNEISDRIRELKHNDRFVGGRYRPHWPGVGADINFNGRVIDLNRWSRESTAGFYFRF